MTGGMLHVSHGIELEGSFTVSGSSTTAEAKTVTIGSAVTTAADRVTVSEGGTLKTVIIALESSQQAGSESTANDRAALDTANGFTLVSQKMPITAPSEGLTISDGLVAGHGIIAGNVHLQPLLRPAVQLGSSNGTLLLTGNLDGTGLAAVGDESTLDLSGAVASGITIQFHPSEDVVFGSGILRLEAPSQFSGKISLFHHDSVLDLKGIHATHISYSANVLTVTDPLGDFQFNVSRASDAKGFVFSFHDDGSGGTDIVMTPKFKDQVLADAHAHTPDQSALFFALTHALLPAAHTGDDWV